MSHAHKADKLLIKPAAGARPAPRCRLDSSFPRHATRPVTRRVTSGTETPGWRRPQTDRPAESHSPPSRIRAVRLLGRVWWSASAVEDVDLDDFAVSHREDGPRCIWHASRCATALPVAASHVEGAQRLSARPDVHTGASVKATPPGFNLLDSRRQSIVEPVVDQKAAAEVPDKTTTLRFALPKRFLNPLPRLTQRNACDRIAGDDQPVLRVC